MLEYRIKVLKCLRFVDEKALSILVGNHQNCKISGLLCRQYKMKKAKAIVYCSGVSQFYSFEGFLQMLRTLFCRQNWEVLKFFVRYSERVFNDFLLYIFGFITGKGFLTCSDRLFFCYEKVWSYVSLSWIPQKNSRKSFFLGYVCCCGALIFVTINNVWKTDEHA